MSFNEKKSFALSAECLNQYTHSLSDPFVANQQKDYCQHTYLIFCLQFMGYDPWVLHRYLFEAGKAELPHN